MSMRTHYCGQVNTQQLDQEITIAGWVHRRRDHGGVIFIDLRDREGLLQLVFNPEHEAVFAQAEKCRSEFVLKATGKVRNRLEGAINPNMASGEVEVLITEMEILNESITPPFHHDEHANEDIRLKYRYIDLRRDNMQKNLLLRHKVTRAMREYLDNNGFVDIETPMLTKATPEGARDYLVPSRTHENKFFALPQSPQLFKQLLMMSGFDRYYQIVRCFRDEDLRADRQPEFTQLDIETSFMEEEDIMQEMEGMTRNLFKKAIDVDLPEFPRMTYAEAMRRYGSDKPDLRIPLELVDIADLMDDVEFKVFAGPAKDPRGRVAALHVPQGSDISRKAIDEYTKFVGRYGARGLAYIKVNDITTGAEGLQSPITKFLTPNSIKGIFGADKANVVSDALGALRVKLGHDRGLVSGDWAPLWVIDFPMFDYDPKEDRYSALHHPFTAPRATPEELKANPEHTVSRAYDMVLNGFEVGGGSVRIHDQELQATVFELLGIGDEEAREKFGFLLDALQFGCPPHGGIALGLDRLVMLMAGS